MVDPKRLIESMELCSGAERDCHKCMYYETENDCRDSMIYDAVELLKEQEPKLVRYTASTVRCPNCNKQITAKGCIHREIKYCWKCGQAVKWDD